MLFRSIAIATILLLTLAGPLVAQAATDKPVKEKDYVPVTTINPAIPTDQLLIMVKPLTKTELEGEAKAWFELLRSKARQISAVQLGVKKTNEAMGADDQQAAKENLKQAQAVKEKAEEEAKQAEEKITEAAKKELGIEGEKKQEPEPPKPEEKEVDIAKNEPSDTKGKLLADVNTLQDERASLASRLTIVLDSLERKGGDTSEYRKYIAAVSGLDVDTSDASATLSTLTGWVMSKEGGQRMGWNLGKFLLILLISWIVAKVIQKIINWLLARKLHLSHLAEDLISRTIKNVVLVVGLAISLTALEIDITPILAAIGATGLVVGLALQGTLSNFASGLMILVTRPFDVGDIVNAGGVTGVIHRMNLVATTFKTFDNQTILVPNNSIWNNVITNITANHTRRVDMEFGISYDDDFEKAEQIILDVLDKNERVLGTPEPQVVTHDLGASSVNIVCRPWARTEDWWPVKTEVTREVKRRFDEAGISIPYPQQDVHFYNGQPSPLPQGQ